MSIRRLGLVLPVVVLLAASCHQGAGVRRQTRLMMDTYVTISVFAPAAQADKAIADAFDRLEEISRKFNHLDSASPVFAFNVRNEPLVDSEIVGIVTSSLAVSEASGGAFDITVEPLVRLWGFYSGQHAVPSQRAIDSCLEFVGYRNLSVAGGRVTKLKAGVTIDLGGITKGYSLAEAARILRSREVSSAAIDAGGDVYVIGKKGTKDWKVGVRNPRGEGIIGVVSGPDVAVVTSGDYERYFFGPARDTTRNPRARFADVPADSVRYCHIIDPRTGWPARGIISTTVIMSDPVMAPAWSKVLFILGPEAMAMGDRAGGFDALLVTDDLKAIATDGLAGVLSIDSEVFAPDSNGR